MAKITWGIRLEDATKTEIENRITDLLQADPEADRGLLLLEGIRALSEERAVSISNHGEDLKGMLAAVEQIKRIAYGVVASADAAESVAFSKYTERIEQLENLLRVATNEKEQAISNARESAIEATRAFETLKTTESALNDKTALTDELRAQIETLKERMLEDAAAVKISAEKLSSLQDDLDAARIEMTATGRALSEREKDIARLEKANAILTTEKDAATEAKAEQKERIADLKADLKRANDRNDFLEAELAAAREKLIEYQILANEKANANLKNLKGENQSR